MKNDQLLSLLSAARQGDDGALALLFSELQAELRSITRQSRMRREGLSMRTTEVFNDSFIKVFGSQVPEVNDKQHLLAVWSNAVRWVVIEARRRKAARPDCRSSEGELLDAVASRAAMNGAGPEEVAEVFRDLKAVCPREGLAAELRLLGGLSTAEIAAGLGTSEQTVRRWVRAGRAWIQLRLDEEEPSPRQRSQDE